MLFKCQIYRIEFNFNLNSYYIADADLFLHGSASQHYVYLETIQEETSDDLRSESDISESRAASPVGWLATDSETGSVIRIHTLGKSRIDGVRSKTDNWENFYNLIRYNHIIIPSRRQ